MMTTGEKIKTAITWAGGIMSIGVIMYASAAAVFGGKIPISKNRRFRSMIANI